jgi:hypothetical protein
MGRSPFGTAATAMWQARNWLSTDDSVCAGGDTFSSVPLTAANYVNDAPSVHMRDVRGPLRNDGERE